jgi:hypothetical protein
MSGCFDGEKLDLLKQLLDVVERNLARESFGVEELADGAALSRTHLNRKLRVLVNLSSAEFFLLDS